MSRDAIFISPANLAARLDDPRVAIVDASWHLPTTGRDAEAEYRAAHIPGAVFFHLDRLSDRTSPFPHMLPDAAAFARDVGALGIADTDAITVYDSAGLYSAPRVRWMFRIFGARDVRILDGGLPAWQAAGQRVTSAPTVRQPTVFRAALAPDVVADGNAVASALEDERATVIDARASARFRGEAPEPRPELSSGHMPGARNLPFTDVVSDGRLAEDAALRTAFAKAGIDPARPLIASCGSGVTACVVALAAEALGHKTARIYDGSWSEWAATPGRAIAKGPA